MIQKCGREAPRTLPQSFHHLLESAAEMLDLRLEVRSSSEGVLYIQAPGRTCSGCAEHGGELFQACQARRRNGGLSLIGPRGPEQWVCPSGCEITVLPVEAPGVPPQSLIAVRSPNGNGSNGPRRADALRFLTRLAHLLGDHLTIARELSSVSAILGQSNEELQLLYTISGRLSEEEDLRKAVRAILAQARSAVQADAAIVLFPQRRFFECATNPAVADTLRAGSGKWRRLVETLSRRMEQENRRFFAGTQRDLNLTDPITEKQAQILATAMRVEDGNRGILCLVHLDGKRTRRANEVKLLEALSERVGMAIANNDLYENLKDFLMATVKSLVSAIEAKDPYTSGHSERVHLLSMLLGKTMGLQAEELEVLKWASILHDVGKIGMPERILNKPGALTPEEWEIMKEHPERGYKVLSPIRQLAAASLGVRSHHEMVNGQGYPMGLKGQEIPRTARIIAVADTYDALTSTRAYRVRQGPDQAFRVIAGVGGSQLDPEIVDALWKLMPFIREHEVMIQTGVLEQSAVSVDEGEEKAA